MSVYLFLRSSRLESCQTSVPIRKQPPRNRRDQGCQTILNLEKSNKGCQTSLVGVKQTEEDSIVKQARESAKLEFNKILEEERKEHQIEVKKLKKKQWCYLCLKEGTLYNSLNINYI